MIGKRIDHSVEIIRTDSTAQGYEDLVIRFAPLLVPGVDNSVVGSHEHLPVGMYVIWNDVGDAPIDNDVRITLGQSQITDADVAAALAPDGIGNRMRTAKIAYCDRWELSIKPKLMFTFGEKLCAGLRERIKAHPHVRNQTFRDAEAPNDMSIAHLGPGIDDETDLSCLGTS